jgi:hypothetical protein
MEATIVFSSYGKILRVNKAQGLYWVPPIMCEFIKVSTQIKTFISSSRAVPDKTGSPMEISTCISYVISSPAAATYQVENVQEYITA